MLELPAPPAPPRFWWIREYLRWLWWHARFYALMAFLLALQLVIVVALLLLMGGA